MMMTKSLNLMPSDPRCALLVIDMQYDFMPGGALAVAEGDALVPLINRLGALFRNVVITQDWHPAGHISFAASHAGRAPFDSITLPYGPQTLWPEHCVQGTHGAALHADLAIDHAQLVLRKGCNAGIDSYSAFVEADRTTQTGLAGISRSAASTACSWSAWRWTSASPGRRWMHGLRGSIPGSLPMRARPSI
jgi:nicotinamidase/pyrazinamidase